jgi:hypothetical protein
MPKNSANEIAFQLESGKTNDAKNSLASEYLSLSPREFRTLINDLELRTKATKAPDVYTQDKGGVFEVFINDTYFDDTRLLHTWGETMTAPGSPAANEKIERAAHNFNRLLRQTSDPKAIDQTTNSAAVDALVIYGRTLSITDRAELYRRAEEINMDYNSSNLPALRVSFQRANGAADNINRAVFNVPQYCTRHGSYDVTSRYDLNTEPKTDK